MLIYMYAVTVHSIYHFININWKQEMSRMFKHFQVLKRDLMRSVRKKRPRMDKFVLHHDNAPSHTSIVTQTTLADLGIDTLQHPPYSPDLAPCDFYLFPTLKADLRGKRFDDVADLPVAVRECIRRIPSNDYRTCFDTWVNR